MSGSSGYGGIDVQKPTIQTIGSSYNDLIDQHTDATSNESIVDEAQTSNADFQELKNPGKPTSDLETLMNLIKASVGVSILAMPSALANAGLLLGSICILVVGFITTYCMKQLVDVSNFIKHQNPHLIIHNYSDACSYAFSLGPLRFRSLSKLVGILVDVFIVVSQLLACAAYTLFVAQTASQIVEVTTGFYMKIQLWVLAVMVVLVPIGQARSLKIMSFLSLAANVSIAAALVIILQFIIRNRTIAIENLPLVAPIGGWPLAFCIVLFSFDINLVMSIRGKMAKPSHFDGWNGILILGMTIVACVDVLVSFFGYLYVGESFTGVITDYMIPLFLTESIGWIYLVSVVLAAAQVCVSYGIQSLLIVLLLFPLLAEKFKLSARGAVIGETLFRLSINVLSLAIAAGVPCVNELLAFIGALTGSFLVFIFPPIMSLLSFGPLYIERCQHFRLVWLITKDAFLVLIGLAGLTVGCVTSINTIVFKLSNDQCTQ